MGKNISQLKQEDNSSIFPMGKIEVPCLEAVQPLGSMYIAVIDYATLEYISETDVRRMVRGRDVEEYTGIQRELNQSREKEIGRYVNLVDASFPNSIILSISSEHAIYNPDTKKLTIDCNPSVAKVLDGQHRIAGLKHFKNENGTLKFDCVVTIYIDMDLEDQALIFATINKEQKIVSQSLVADLYAFAKSRSPQRTCHKIARVLNSNESSPFYKKIKILGVASEEEKLNASITQATFVKCLMKYISADAQMDRDFYRRNFETNKKPQRATAKEKQKLFFRDKFIDDNEDYYIAQCVWNFFYAVNKKWPKAWGELKQNNILNKSTGFIALMNLMKDAYHDIGKYDEIPSKEDFENIINRISFGDNHFTTENYKPGSSGQSALYKDLIKEAQLNIETSLFD